MLGPVIVSWQPFASFCPMMLIIASCLVTVIDRIPIRAPFRLRKCEGVRVRAHAGLRPIDPFLFSYKRRKNDIPSSPSIARSRLFCWKDGSAKSPPSLSDVQHLILRDAKGRGEHRRRVDDSSPWERRHYLIFADRRQKWRDQNLPILPLSERERLEDGQMRLPGH